MSGRLNGELTLTDVGTVARAGETDWSNNVKEVVPFGRSDSDAIPVRVVGPLPY
jgi:hypothetical protein